ncbi:septation initiation network scaffold protein cdc11 [Cordyceps fumosorosea ARSEF 2679]|uniref:Septation initiation network scaffold protein cdc11 n=1 Tax=Cordyceps fumosorosea (strain ARSEF 2679) TaxID=1081104 RepID=A0A162LFC5_CORFA|nr:septation initiation network scaffold protein cdc11 [Cordyceps fumosorosea ARSEF 2679]OAA69854.1 septation initiation network scaffold protein cdc11 [Cordyceps fumosorosea ARSEF 2679]
MAHAWLDSLSEDWVSEPRSDASEVQLPPLKAPADATPSKIPRRTGANPVYSPITGNSSHILNERSANEINIPQNKRPSKLSRELNQDAKDSRSVSVATCGSVVHKAVDLEAEKDLNPEWKRRLINGEVQYGEQRDLFCSAATGLQDMFKPPQMEPADAQCGQAIPDRTMPSSPPLYQYEPDEDIDRLLELAEQDEHEFPEQVTPSPSPRRGIRSTHFRSTSNGNNSFLPSLPMENYVDESPLQHVAGIARTKVVLNAPHHAQGSLRQVSGQTDFDNEDFSPIMIGRQDEEDGQVKFGSMNIPIGELQSKLERVEKNQASDAGDTPLHPGATVDSASEIDALDRFTRNAGQINLRRGGRSGDGSFYSRALSPDLGVDTSEMLPEESLQASTPKEFPTIRTQLPSRGASQSMASPPLPRAPFPSPDKRSLNPSGSPLKLFGPYDTFTNQTLLRRISQYEDVDSANSSAQGQELVDPEKSDDMDRSRRSVSYFGGGQLDDYEFTADISEAHDIFDGTDKENVSPEAHMIPMGSRRRISFGNASKILITRRRERSGVSTDALAEAQRLDIVQGAPELGVTPGSDPDASEMKRTRNSPVKDPTPKRRRTLRRSDATYNRQEQFSQVDAAHQQMQNIMGRKRKDARPGQFQIAEADVLAARKILKPCSPASSPKSSRDSDDSLVRANQTGVVPTKTERKPSIKTQDFVDQAAQIMAMIRNQVKPTGLASLEESEEEHNTVAEGEIASAGGSQPDSTYEPLSRPPSREGRQSPNYQERLSDPELEARLKKYKEMSDMGDLATSSMRSVGMGQDELRAAYLDIHHQQSTFGRASASLPMPDKIVSDLENVRISGPFLNSSLPASPSRGFPSNSSAHSANTVPTTSSTSSDTRRTIMPESVSHLIPDRVGSMYLDKSQNIWIKKKEANPEAQNNSIAATDDSEEDPFASIPDLTVDMTQELRSLKRVMADGQGTGATGPLSSPRPPQLVLVPSSPQQEDDDVEELPNIERREIQEAYSSRNGTTKRRNMTISFSSPIASIIQEAVAMGAESFGDETTPRSINYDKSPDQSPPDSFAGQKALRQMDNKSRPPTMRYVSQQGPDFVRRPVSPINEQDEDGTVELPANEANQLSFIGERGLMNYGGQESRHASLSLIISRTPGNKSLTLAGDESAIIGQNIGHMSLSPLSEFNVTQGDQSFGFEVSYVLGNRHLSTGDGSKKVMSLTIRELVERLSEVEPCEPYWQDIEELNLSEKRLSSLHMLEEFCGKVVTLDASQNALGHLEGVPSSVRQLKVSQNMLTELTSWNHLVNLQYVDISGNEVKSLSALRNLVHLRSIKADNNKLTSLSGLESHQGLLSLRARDNLIEELDFEDSTFDRLTELDLTGNMIEVVRNLHLAPCLSKLKLSSNKLQTFDARQSCKTVRHLDVSHNQLRHLDVSGLPNLHTLLADSNQLPDVTGLQRTRRLDSLSLREQRGQEPLTLEFLSVGYEVRKLYLSGNYLESFEPKVDLLNLQLLELANCGLTSLPENVGQLMPNLRSLNINFNAISNVKPLEYIPRLKKLMMAGNRLADSTSVTQLLMDFPHLTRLDTRDNPMTLGFYAPLQALVKANGEETSTPFALPDADEERDELYVSRLDEATKLRRRLHQVVLAASCSRLRMLDGLPVQRKRVLAMDSLLVSLVEEGLVEVPEQKEKSDKTQESCEKKEEDECEEAQSSRWNAEDSFA